MAPQRVLPASLARIGQMQGRQFAPYVQLGRTSLELGPNTDATFALVALTNLMYNQRHAFLVKLASTPPGWPQLHVP